MEYSFMGFRNWEAKGRIIRLDPVEHPKFDIQGLPKPSLPPLLPARYSPPPVNEKDQQIWKTPPTISNWKNPKGYVVPLGKRLAADGRGLEEFCVKLPEAMYVAEQEAREELARKKARQELARKEARSEKTVVAPAAAAVPIPSERGGINDGDMSVDYERVRDAPKETKEEREEWLHGEKIHEERRKERERERRLEAEDAAVGKKSKITRDGDRDISEKVALGMGEVMYDDQRSFNQEKWMDSGFANDDADNIYDKGLFTTQSTMTTLYRPKKDVDGEMHTGADEQLEKLMKTERFKLDNKAFAGTTGPRERPVEFQKDQQPEEDPFGLDQLLREVKMGKKVMDIVVSLGYLEG